MIVFYETMLFICAFGVLFCVLMLFRNVIIYRIRVELIYSDYNTYKMLPSYHDMMYKHLFRWNKKSFLSLVNNA